jgi:hypothetical protein
MQRRSDSPPEANKYTEKQRNDKMKEIKRQGGTAVPFAFRKDFIAANNHRGSGAVGAVVGARATRSSRS